METPTLSTSSVRSLLRASAVLDEAGIDAFAALARLPLSSNAWLRVSQVGVRLLENRDALERQGRRVLFAAARVPVEDVRQRLYHLLASESDQRLTTAEALADVRDPAARAVLGDLAATGDQHAARAGARVGFGTRASDVVRATRTSSSLDFRFWAALGLAHDGYSAPLRRILLRLSRSKDEFNLLESRPADPQLWDSMLTDVAPLAPDAVKVLRSIVDLKGLRRLLVPGRRRRERLKHLADQLLWAHSSAEAGDAVESMPASTQHRPRQTLAERAEATRLVEDLMAEVQLSGGYGEQGESEWQLWNHEEDLRLLFPALSPETSSQFVNWLIRNTEPSRIDIGNLIVELVSPLRDTFDPNIEELFSEYKRLRRDDIGRNLSWQVSWLVSRAPIDNVIRRLSPALESPSDDERSIAAKFIEDVARYRTHEHGPGFGGGEAPSDVPAADLGEMLALDRVRPTDELSTLRSPQPMPRSITTGFSYADEPTIPLDSDIPLSVDSTYFFWIHVGTPQPGGIDVRPTSVPVAVPENVDLDIALFSIDSALILDNPRSSGTIRLSETASPTVVLQPTQHVPDVEGRLYFKVLTTNVTGRHALRCNLYCRQALVQSYLVQVEVAGRPAPMAKALTAELDFALSASIDATQFAEKRTHVLSLMVNDNRDGTHGFMFSAMGDEEGPYVSASRFQAGEIQDHVDSARGALRLAAFGHEDAFKPEWEQDFKYRANSDRSTLVADLSRLAIRGYRIYRMITGQLAPPSPGIDRRMAREDLQRRMRRPGMVQVVSKISPTLYLPAAVFYDYPLNDSAQPSGLCEAFVRALDRGEDLLTQQCLTGDCPNYGDERRVCPSGFWGYRHAIGLPTSMPVTSFGAAAQQDAANHIYYTGKPLAAVALSPDLADGDMHVRRLAALDNVTLIEPASSRDATMRLLESAMPQIVYFYCHGGKHGQIPYLRVGPPNGANNITPANIMDHCYWPTTRPIVIINGCHTTGLGPREANQFVSAFTGEPMASGVVGTETTIVEELATVFAETLFSESITIPYDDTTSYPIGEAVRRARLRLLESGNPLGLVYVPFISPDLDIRPVLGPQAL